MTRRSPYPLGTIREKAFRMTDPVLDLTDAKLSLMGNAGPVDILREVDIATVTEPRHRLSGLRVERLSDRNLADVQYDTPRFSFPG